MGRGGLTRMRPANATARWLALGCLLLAGLGACTGGDEPEASGSPPTTPAPTPAPTPEGAVFATPPGGGELRVAETGFSATPDPEGVADGPEGIADDILSYGVVVENTSGSVAHNITVDVRLLDAGGNTIDEISGEPITDPSLRQVLTRLLPGERIGVGSTVPHHGAEVAEVRVELEPGLWSGVAGDFWAHQPITTSAVTTRHGRDGSTLAFTVDASYTREMLRGQLRVESHYSAIFRDGDGTVVGGVSCCTEPGGPDVTVEVPPGPSQAELHLDNGTPATADDTRTEIYTPDPREYLPQ